MNNYNIVMAIIIIGIAIFLVTSTYWELQQRHETVTLCNDINNTVETPWGNTTHPAHDPSNPLHRNFYSGFYSETEQP